jgi:hypothetical protein
MTRTVGVLGPYPQRGTAGVAGQREGTRAQLARLSVQERHDLSEPQGRDPRIEDRVVGRWTVSELGRQARPDRIRLCPPEIRTA